MFVGGLVLDPNTQAPVVILKDEAGGLALPIWIGVAEATSIASAIKQLTMARPLTHDLMSKIFDEVGVKVQRIIITELKESTYFAELILSFGDKVMVVDSRPSDAIAIALRAEAQIFVAKKVLEQAKVAFPNMTMTEAPKTPDSSQGSTDASSSAGAEGDEEEEQGPNFSGVKKEEWEDLLKKLDPDDFKYKM